MIRAVVFDFNGTLSLDEDVWFEVYRRLYEARGRPITRDEYYGRLAGLSDEEGVRAWLGADHPGIDEVVTEGVAEYLALAGNGSTVPIAAREALAAAAELVPVAIVTTARREVLETVLAATRLAPKVAFTITAGDVARTKPDPEGYLLAIARFGDGIAPADVLVFEDTPLGVAAAKAAGTRCVAVLGSAPPERLSQADEIVERLDAATVRRLVA